MLLCDMASVMEAKVSPRFSSPTGLNDPEIEDALRTPKGILPQAKGRRMSKSPINGVSIFQMSIPNTHQPEYSNDSQTSPDLRQPSGNVFKIPLVPIHKLPQRPPSPSTPTRRSHQNDDMDISPGTPIAGDVAIVGSQALNAARSSPLRRKNNNRTDLNEKFEEFQTEWQERQLVNARQQTQNNGLSHASNAFLKEQLQNIRSQKILKKPSSSRRTKNDILTPHDTLTPRDNLTARDYDHTLQVIPAQRPPQEDRRPSKKKVKFAEPSSLNVSSEMGPPSKVPSYMQNTASAQQRVTHTLLRRESRTSRQVDSPPNTPFFGMELSWKNNKENTSLTAPTSGGLFSLMNSSLPTARPNTSLPKKVSTVVISNNTTRPATAQLPMRALPTKS